MKILIFTKNWLGDILFEVPALQALRENFPAARLVALAPERCQEILKGLPYLDEVRVFDERASERPLGAKIRFLAWLRKEKFDKAFLFHRSLTRALLAKWGGIPERIGYQSPKRGKGVLTLAVPPPRQAIHQNDYFLVLLKWAGLKVRFGAEYEFFFGSENEKEAARLSEIHRLENKRFIAFHVGANWAPKRWPASHFAELADLIATAYSCPIVLTGSLADQRIADEIQAHCHARLVSLCGQTSLGVLGAFFKTAAFVVSSDSGPMHIASGVGTPVAALFGPTCPKMTGPRGKGKKMILSYLPQGYSVPWLGNDFPAGGWMEHIRPRQVFDRIEQERLWKSESISSSSR